MRVRELTPKELELFWWVAMDRMGLGVEDLVDMKSETLQKLVMYALRKDGPPP